jgi:hypothetical protein
MTPAVLEAYARDVVRDRQQAAAHAALVAQARQRQPLPRPHGSTGAFTAISHLGPLAVLAAIVRK